MKSYNDLLEIEKTILNHTFNAGKKLWGGAGQTVALPAPSRVAKEGLIIHKEAYEISTLIFMLMEIIPYDYMDKFELFESLLVDLPEKEACLEIIGRAKKIFFERATDKLHLVDGGSRN